MKRQYRVVSIGPLLTTDLRYFSKFENAQVDFKEVQKKLYPGQCVILEEWNNQLKEYESLQQIKN